MHDQPNLELLDLMDEAVLDASRWSTVLERFADLVGAGGATLFSRTHGLGVWSRTAEEARAMFYERFQDNPIQSALVETKRAAKVPLGVLPDRLLVDRERLVHSAFYNDYMALAEVEEILVTDLARQDWRGAFNLGRSRRAGPFTREEIDRVAALRPYLARSFWLSVDLRIRERSADGLRAAFDDAVDPIFIVSAEGAVWRANAAAEALARSGAALKVIGGRLKASDARSVEGLGALVAAAAGQAGRPGRGGSLPLYAAERELPMLVTATPVRAGSFADVLGGRCILLRVSDLQAKAELRDERLCAIFGLTPGEIRVARALFDGETLREAAERLGLSFFTVRAHLARIFQKTGAHRQADLIRLLERTAVPT